MMKNMSIMYDLFLNNYKNKDFMPSKRNAFSIN
jgi:hypothetical protein